MLCPLYSPFYYINSLAGLYSISDFYYLFEPLIGLLLKAGRVVRRHLGLGEDKELDQVGFLIN